MAKQGLPREAFRGLFEGDIDELRKAPEEDPKRGPSSQGVRTVATARALLFERDNPREQLQFHWNPTSYSIGKSAKWSETGVSGGTPTMGYSGCGLTEISFSLLLNDLGPHPGRRNKCSTEEALSWLFRRLRPRTLQDRDRKVSQNCPQLPWLNVRDPKAKFAPPILVLIGLGEPFECVMTNCKAKTIFQEGLASPEIAVQQGRFSGFDVDAARRASLAKGNVIRATVDISLKEYTNAADAEEES